jgi:hypothetical protein
VASEPQHFRSIADVAIYFLSMDEGEQKERFKAKIREELRMLKRRQRLRLIVGDKRPH